MHRALHLCHILMIICVVSAVDPALAATPKKLLDPTLHESVKKTMLDQRGDLAVRAFGVSDKAALPAVRVQPSRISGDGQWVFGAVAIPVPDRVHGSPEAALFIARRTPNSWQVALEATDEFVSLAESAPLSVVRADEKVLFRKQRDAQGGGTGNLLEDTGLMLPWPPGTSWRMSGGLHGNGGYDRPFSALDLTGGDGRVLAARDGNLYNVCGDGYSQLVRIIHNNGYSTQYYHLREQPSFADGALVSRGTYLGLTGCRLPCGGACSGPHVHFVLRQGGAFVSLEGKAIGGWTFHEGSSAYGGWAEHQGTRVGVGGYLYNYYSDPPSTLPTGTVNVGSGNTLALRSGPSTSHTRIGSKNHGEVVRIQCTGRGQMMTGTLGTTDLWDRLDTGEWASDAYIDTGTNEPVAPDCACSTCQANSSSTRDPQACGTLDGVKGDEAQSTCEAGASAGATGCD
jgi:LasA protease